MCLWYSKEATDEFLKSSKDKIVCYKVLRSSWLTLYSPIFKHRWKNGWNIATQTSCGFVYKELKSCEKEKYIKSVPIEHSDGVRLRQVINNGIHTFIDYDKAKSHYQDYKRSNSSV